MWKSHSQLCQMFICPLLWRQSETEVWTFGLKYFIIIKHLWEMSLSHYPRIVWFWPTVVQFTCCHHLMLQHKLINQHNTAKSLWLNTSQLLTRHVIYWVCSWSSTLNNLFSEHHERGTECMRKTIKSKRIKQLKMCLRHKHLKQTLENNVMWKYFILTCWQIEEMYNTNLKC